MIHALEIFRLNVLFLHILMFLMENSREKQERKNKNKFVCSVDYATQP